VTVVLVVLTVVDTGGAMVRMRFLGLRTVEIVLFSLFGSSSWSNIALKKILAILFDKPSS